MNFLACATTTEPRPATFRPTEIRIPVKLNDAITSASCQQVVQCELKADAAVCMHISQSDLFIEKKKNQLVLNTRNIFFSLTETPSGRYYIWSVGEEKQFISSGKNNNSTKL